MMTWSISLFFVLLLVILLLLAITTLQVNDFEKKADKFCALLKKRYDLEKLRNAFAQKAENEE